ncbi:MAG: SDR family NAD(P)-dependent oxidoreductase [Gammaproteobacteria bacterium]|nr:SDR family NAD(P)-dependent oxidoreductase [Gammaproteobacteria bacterium]
MATESKNKPLTPLQKAFLTIETLQARLDSSHGNRNEPIAVIGMSCRFPGGSDSVEQYWNMLLNGVDAAAPISDDRWKHSSIFDPDQTAPGTTYVSEAAFLDQVDSFDAEFFAIPPREANYIDPQQRLLLELGYETLQHAGIASQRLKDSRTGVYVGIGQHDYLELLRQSSDLDSAGVYTGTGNGFCFASGRLSYQLGLQGPSFSIDTACSSSLLAVHQACLSLRARECNLALAGGVQLMLSPSAFVFMSDARALATDGRCKSFAAAADGYGRGEGAGMVALKRWSDAQSDGDRVLAVIRGSVVDHDGHSSGLTVPNGRAQQQLLQQLLDVTETAADALGYVEAHGTGTALGDPIEYNALAQVLRKNSQQPLLLGSVKTNIGHLEAAAGIAGLIKLILSIQHGKIPASLHFDQPNPAISWSDYPLKVADRLSDWPQNAKSRIGMVSSFGLSGTNVQIMVAEPDQQSEAEPESTAQQSGSYLFKLSARSDSALRDWVTAHISKLATLKPRQLVDFCYSANISRDDDNWRIATVVTQVEQLHSFLNHVLHAQTLVPVTGVEQGPVFLFAGQGSVTAGAGHALYLTQPVFSAALQTCDDAMLAQNRPKLSDILYGSDAASLLARTEHEQVALFGLQYALARMWMAWGIKPSMVLGHSVGEYAAACLAGVFDVNSAIAILCCRGRVMQALPETGAMLAVFADQLHVQALLDATDCELSIAAINADQQVVVSGHTSGLQQFDETAQQQGFGTAWLPVKRGFHSAQIDAVLPGLAACLEQIPMSKPSLRFVSSVTGSLETDRVASADYWLRQARQPVLFTQALASTRQLEAGMFIEMGARPVLSGLVSPSSARVFCALNNQTDDWTATQTLLTELYLEGYVPDWVEVYRNRRGKLISLPNYPWQRKRYWFSETSSNAAGKPQFDPASSIHPFIQRAIETPLWSGRLYQGQIGCQQQPCLLDHKVFDGVLVAGACHLSALIAIGRSVLTHQPFAVEKIEFIEALQLTEQEQRELHIGMTEQDGQGCKIQVISRDNQQNTGYSEHLHAQLVESTVELHCPDLAELQEQCHIQLDTDHFYQLLSSQHVELGVSFRWFQQLYTGNNQALAKIRPATIEEQAFGIPPGLIDACFQLMGAAVPEQYTQTYIPVAVKQLCLSDISGLTECWCHALLDKNTAGQKGLVSGKVTVFDLQGRVIFQLMEASLRLTSQDAIQHAVLADQLTYTLDWQHIGQSRDRQPESEPRSWLVVGETLAKAVAESSHSADWLSPKQFLNQESSAPQAVLLCLDGSAVDADLALQTQHNLETVLLCLKKIIQFSEQGSVRLAVITRLSRSVNHEKNTDPAVLAIAGMLRSFHHEYPATQCQWLDVDESVLTLDHISFILNSNPAETELCLRSGQLYCPRMQQTTLLNQPDQSRLHGTYLLTGGSGALALQTARRLVKRGVSKLILVSRGGLSDADRHHYVDEFGQDVELLDVKADVADAEQVRDLLQLYGKGIRGIIHAAGILDDSAIANTGFDQLAAVLKPKLTGVWNLHQYSKELELDCFIVYSSIAALLGAPGQSSYAAANSAMDGFIAWRRQQGLAGLSINWGPWTGSGMAHKQQDSQLAETGISKLTSDQALKTLDQVLTDTQLTQSQCAVFNINWHKYPLNPASLTKQLQPQHPAQQDHQQPVLSEQISNWPVRQRKRMLRAYLVEQVAAVLRLPDAGQLNSDAGFSELGMDSIMILDLRNRLQRAINQELPSTLAYKHPSVNELLEHLMTEVFADYFTEQTVQPISDKSTFDESHQDIAELLEQELLQLESEHIND